MSEINYITAYDLNSATRLLEINKDAKIFAGGTELVQQIKDSVLTEVKLLINVKNIAELSGIKISDTKIVLGSNVTLKQVLDHEEIQQKFPFLINPIINIASPQIRNIATVGGNIAQEVRCWYYRYPRSMGGEFLCFNRGGKKCYADTGDNRYHSIFKTTVVNGCKAVNASDLLSVLVLLDAQIKTNVREIKAKYFNPKHLLYNEIIVKIEIPINSFSKVGMYYEKIRVRDSIDFAIVSLASKVLVVNNIVQTARFVFGGVAYQPYESDKLNHKFYGFDLGSNILKRVNNIDIYANCLSGNSYKLQLMRALIYNALMKEKKNTET